MRNTAQVRVNLFNEAQSTSPPGMGVMFLVGETLKGPTGNPIDLITSKARFERIFGGTVPDNDFPLTCLQALETGAQLRISRVVGSSALKAESAWVTGFIPEPGTPLPGTTEPGTTLPGTTEPPGTEPGFTEEPPGLEDPASMNLFRFVAKGAGTYPNNYTAIVSLGPTGFFNVTLMDLNSDYEEDYINLQMPSNYVGPYNYLKDISKNSLIVDVEYADISGETGLIGVVSDEYGFSGGTDDSPLLANYVSALQGFNEYDEAFILSIPCETQVSMAGIVAAGTAYAQSRKDLIYLQPLDNSLKTSSAIINHLDSLAGLNNRYLGIIGGGIKISDLFAGGLKDMNPMGPLLGKIAEVHRTLGIWRNPTNYAAGRLALAQGVVNNFGSPATSQELNLIAQAGANMVINRGGDIMLWDFYSRDTPNSPDKFLAVVLLQIYIIKVLKPLLESFLGQPNTFSTFKAIYQSAKPFMDSLISQEALMAYKWDGDQDATSLDDLQINTPTEIGQGKYKVQLQIKVTVPLVDITLNIVMTENSVDFS